MNIKFDESFNWLAVLKDLAAGMPITDEERGKLHTVASKWPKCACGQLCAGLSRNSNGAPCDDRLCSLGLSFCFEIGEGNWPAGLRTFRQIEARASELLGLNEPSPQSTSSTTQLARRNQKA